VSVGAGSARPEKALWAQRSLWADLVRLGAHGHLHAGSGITHAPAPGVRAVGVSGFGFVVDAAGFAARYLGRRRRYLAWCCGETNVTKGFGIRSALAARLSNASRFSSARARLARYLAPGHSAVLPALGRQLRADVTPCHADCRTCSACLADRPGGDATYDTRAHTICRPSLGIEVRVEQILERHPITGIGLARLD
jgi:hypothetical protein